MLHEYKEKLESTKTIIAKVAMDSDIEFEEKNKKLNKMAPVYQSYNLVVEVLEEILDDSQENKDELEGSDLEAVIQKGCVGDEPI